MKCDCLPYISFNIGLHGCVKDPEKFAIKLKSWLIKELKPEYKSDINIDIEESAGWEDAEMV